MQELPLRRNVAWQDPGFRQHFVSMTTNSSESQITVTDLLIQMIPELLLQHLIRLVPLLKALPVSTRKCAQFRNAWMISALILPSALQILSLMVYSSLQNLNSVNIRISSTKLTNPNIQFSRLTIKSQPNFVVNKDALQRM